MRIIHVCLAAIYVDNFSYQENVLPRMHKLQNNEVMILASTEVLNKQNKIEYVNPSKYSTKEGIPIVRVPYVKWLPPKLGHKTRVYSGVREILETFLPDLIFLHDIQFLSIYQIRKYVKKNPNVRIVADGHADYINSARGFISKNILHAIIYRFAAKMILPYTSKFYGTLPSRVNFFQEMYKIPTDKTDFLPMGADDTLLNMVINDDSRQRIREKYGFSNKDIVLITGGKIDRRKIEILDLMSAVSECEEHIKLIVFGAVESELKNEFESRLVPNKIVMHGWADEKESYQVLNSADVAVFPCLHSTLWEQSAGIGLPCILHEMEGFKHLNIQDNCVFVKECNKENLLEAIKYCVKNLNRLKKNADNAKEYFSYNNIAMRILDELN